MKNEFLVPPAKQEAIQKQEAANKLEFLEAAQFRDEMIRLEELLKGKE